MEEDIISFETAKLAREKGYWEFKEDRIGNVNNQLIYDEDGTLCCLDFDCNPYNNTRWFTIRKVNCDDSKDVKAKRTYHVTNLSEIPIMFYFAPTQSIFQKWLREVYNIQVYAYSSTVNANCVYRDYVAYVNLRAVNDARDEEYQTYGKALDFGLREGLKIIS